MFPFLLLGAAEVFVVFRNAGHFFNADTLFWMWNRYHSLQEFAAGFFKLDPAFWYRPISQRTVESLLYPFAGLNPIPYRVVGFILFFACTLVVFHFVLQVTGSRKAAWFGVLLFAPHVVAKFVTYDVAFTPDLLLMLFSVGSATAYVVYLKSGKRSLQALSLSLFVTALLSKETAAGLPFALLALWFFMHRSNSVSAASILPQFAILAIHLVLMFGLLNVRNLEVGHVLGWLPQDPGDYRFAAGENLLQNLTLAFSWIFGIPNGVHGQWFFDAPWVLPALNGIRVLACMGALMLLFGPQRKIVLIGLSWFIAMIVPALLLKTHFLPYYLFVPLVGTAVIGGTILDSIHKRLEEWSPKVALVSVLVVLAVWTKGQVHAANRVALIHPILGGAAIRSGMALEDVQGSYPTLPEGKQLIFLNEGLPAAAGDQAFGALFRMAYGNPSLVVHYSSLNLPQNLKVEDVLVFKWMHGRFVDVTSQWRHNSAPHD
jgi:hypothetical protein